MLDGRTRARWSDTRLPAGQFVRKLREGERLLSEVNDLTELVRHLKMLPNSLERPGVHGSGFANTRRVHGQVIVVTG